MKWSNVWSYTQQDYRSWPSELENHLQVIRIRSHHYAKKLKIRFSNEFGQENLMFEQVCIRTLSPETLNPGDWKMVTVGRQRKITIIPTAQLLSDEIELEVTPGMIFEIETLIHEKTVLQSGTVSYSRRELEVYNYRIHKEKKEFIEQRHLFRMVKENERMFYVYGVCGIDLLVKDSAKTIVAFGDSLTQQGFWVDHLKARLSQSLMPDVSVLNRGIGGSRILKGQNPANDAFTRHGNAGLFRFEREVFMYGQVDVVICLHGINDLISHYDGTGEYGYTLKDIQNGLKQYAAFAHHHAVKVFIATLMPIGNSVFYCEDLESERQKLNAWIRQNKIFDGVLDFDFAVRDLAQPHLLKSTYDCGDGIHLSDQGGKKIAEAIDLSYINSII